ncbi:MAG: hypothetical protein MIO88_03710, partial [Methanoregulaceae archaeon]|nr:hypothetical protein [Methanoregulaceae archaeon]
MTRKVTGLRLPVCAALLVLAPTLLMLLLYKPHPVLINTCGRPRPVLGPVRRVFGRRAQNVPVMIRRRFHLRETIATILADDEAHISAARDGIIAARQELERYAAGDPFFLSTLEPYPVSSGIAIVDRMADAGVAAGVGPMAAVAGAIAWSGVEAMQEAGAA